MELRSYEIYLCQWSKFGLGVPNLEPVSTTKKKLIRAHIMKGTILCHNKGRNRAEGSTHAWITIESGLK